MKRFAGTMIAVMGMLLGAQTGAAQEWSQPWARLQIKKSPRHNELGYGEARWPKRGDAGGLPGIERQAARGAGDSRNLWVERLGAGTCRRSGCSRLHRRRARPAERHGAERRADEKIFRKGHRG